MGTAVGFKVTGCFVGLRDGFFVGDRVAGRLVGDRVTGRLVGDSVTGCLVGFEEGFCVSSS